MPAYGSPRLIAVNHVLHRLPVPRHSPCALCSLTFFYYAILLNDFFELFHSFENVFYYPFLKNNIVTFQDGRHNAYLSFVLHYFVQFSRCDFWITWIQISILNTKYWNLISNFSSKGIFLLTRSGTQRCIYIHASASDKVKRKIWWAQEDSNLRPHAYQACALTTWAMSPNWWR